jgi:Raf kinase inhibitor-like YbhB/YbcL family protein
MTFQLTSSAFKAGGPIPARFTCDAEDVSPPLVWSGAPEGTRSFALIVDDPDAPDPKAPKMVYVHWVVCDIPPSTTSLPEHATSSNIPKGAREGRNDWKNIGYGGPCPPIGRHRYFFKLYALDTTLGDALDDIGVVTKADVERAMRGHVLAEAELIGTYQGQHGPAKPRR